MFPEDPLAERGNTSLMDFNTTENEQWANLFMGGNKPVKTFVRTTAKIDYSEQNQNQTHNPINNNQKSYMCNGERLFKNWYHGPETDNDLKILHYQYKSADEWRWKCKNRLALYGNKPSIYTQGQEKIIDRMK